MRPDFAPAGDADGADKRLGESGEAAATAFLKQRGYRIVARNWRPGAGGGAMRGEIDCIAWHGNVLCFIEVKTRSSLVRGAAQEAVNLSKQRQICRLANAYVCAQRLQETACRFDVVEVLMSEGGGAPRIALCENAFDYSEARGPRSGRRSI